MFTKELIGLDVVTVKGSKIGTLEDIVIETGNGSVKYLLVASNGSVHNVSQKVDGEGRLVVETDRIRVQDGAIVIN